MDIEFVYNPSDHQINIVQARAIPEGARKGLEPSAVSPQFLAKTKSQLTTIQGLQVITPEVNKVAIITDPRQVIICNNIGDALYQYNKASDKVAAVIVQQPAPNTSHEAGVFNASSITVMQVSDIAAVQELLKKNNHLIIDPQHSSIYQLPEGQFALLDQANIEQSLYDEEIIAKGIYASTLSSYVTPTKYSFSQDNLSQIPVELAEHANMGQLINKAQTGNKVSTDQLLSLAYQAMDFRENKDVGTQSQDKAQKLRDNIAALSLPKIGENNDQAKAALSYNLRAVADSYKKGLISVDLFKQTMISGAELSILLDNMSQQKNLNKPEQDKAYLEYFNIQKKFTGMLIGTGGKNILADSLVLSLQQQYAKQADKLINELLPKSEIREKVTDQQKSYLTESLKLGDYFLSEEKQREWQEFCGKICTTMHLKRSDELPAQGLGTLVNQLVSLGVQQQWLNLIFTETNKPKNALQTLYGLYQDFNQIDLSKIKEASATISSMRAQIPQWADPAKFPGLFKELQTNIANLNQQLKWPLEASDLEKILTLEQVSRLTDILDKSIKSLERSTLYPENAKDDRGNDLQVARFKDMITEFHGLMKVWVAEGTYKNSVNELRNQDDFLKSKDKSLTKAEFNPSPNFAVNRATINITGIKAVPDTLEDFFTLVHQNMMVATADLATAINQIIIKQSSKLLQGLNESFNNQLVQPPTRDRDSSAKINPSTTINLQDGFLVIEKNIPLRGHSCMAEIIYDTARQQTSVKFSAFGHNAESRMDNIALDNYLDLKIAGFEFIQPPRHDEKKMVVEFEVKIANEQQISQIITAINKSIETTYLHDVPEQVVEKKKRLQSGRLKLLAQCSDEQLKEIMPIAKTMLVDIVRFGPVPNDANLEVIKSLLNYLDTSTLLQNITSWNFHLLDIELQKLYAEEFVNGKRVIDKLSLDTFISSDKYDGASEIFRLKNIPVM